MSLLNYRHMGIRVLSSSGMNLDVISKDMLLRLLVSKQRYYNTLLKPAIIDTRISFICYCSHLKNCRAMLLPCHKATNKYGRVSKDFFIVTTSQPLLQLRI